MENQHRKIVGYRELSQHEIDTMNKVKQKGIELQSLIDECKSIDDADIHTADDVLSDAERWRYIAKTRLQEGLMALTRSIAKPGFF